MIGNSTTISLQNLTSIANNTHFTESLVKMNHIVYNGWFWFIILWLFWFIAFMTMQKVKDQPLNNAMYSFSVVTVLALLSRVFTVMYAGSLKYLITDHQLWVFPIFAVVIAMIIYATKKD